MAYVPRHRKKNSSRRPFLSNDGDIPTVRIPSPAEPEPSDAIQEQLLRPTLLRLTAAFRVITLTQLLVATDERIVFDADVPDGRVIVKVDRVGDRFLREVAALRSARLCGLPVQRVVFAEQSDRSIIVLQRLGGQPVRLKDRVLGWMASSARSVNSRSGLVFPATGMLTLIISSSTTQQARS